MPLLYSYKQVVSLLLVCLILLCVSNRIHGETEQKPLCSTEECRRLGDERIRQGKYSEGIKYYSDAISQFETKTNLIENLLIVDYLKILFKRAEVYYLNKQYEFSTKDLDLFTKLFEENKHEEVESHLHALYEQVLKLRGKLGLLLGNFEQAVKDLSTFTDSESMRQRRKAEDALYALENAEETFKKGKYTACVENYGIILNELSVAQENLNFRLKRAECAFKAKDNTNFMAELKRIIAKEKNNVAAILLYAQYLYRLGSVDQALGQVRACLRDDPDNTQCRKVLKEIQNNEKLYSKAKAAWDEKSYTKAAKLLEDYLKNSQDPYNLHETYLKLCQAYKETHDNTKAMSYCNKLIEDLQSDTETGTHDMVGEAYLLRAEMHLAAEDYDAALQDAQKAQQAGKAQKAQELLSKIDRLKRQASKKNFYKILGVPKTASKQDIKNAFRKHAKTSHPDKVKFKTEEEKKKNERKFAEITEAYEILIDDEKRRKYDNGEDENGGPQFQHGGHPGFDPFQFFHQGGGARGHPGGGQRFEFRFGGGGPGGGGGFGF